MLRALVSGPFRGKDHWEIARNIRAAETIALAAWRAGLSAYCPHTNTAHFQDAAPDGVWLTGHLAWLEVADVVILTADWQRSAGARRELMEAAELGIPAFVVSEEQDDDPEMLLTESYAIKPVDDGEECDYDLEDDLLEDDETTPFRFALVDLTLREWVREQGAERPTRKSCKHYSGPCSCGRKECGGQRFCADGEAHPPEWFCDRHEPKDEP